jgi:proteic killer suppression protein
MKHLIATRWKPHSCAVISVAPHKQIVYIENMITSFANKETEKLFATGKSKKLPSEIITRAIMRLTQLDNAREVTDLLMPPSNRLETLSGNRAGQWSIRINDQWRVCFQFANGDATDVEITDYH